MGPWLKSEPETGAPHAGGLIGPVIPGERKQESWEIGGVRRSSHCCGRGAPSLWDPLRSPQEGTSEFSTEARRGEYSPTCFPPPLVKGHRLGCLLPGVCKPQGGRAVGAWAGNETLRAEASCLRCTCSSDGVTGGLRGGGTRRTDVPYRAQAPRQLPPAPSLDCYLEKELALVSEKTQPCALALRPRATYSTSPNLSALVV